MTLTTLFESILNAVNEYKLMLSEYFVLINALMLQELYEIKSRETTLLCCKWIMLKYVESLCAGTCCCRFH